MNGLNSDQTAPPKRMRLGTRSCVECRRRKVRCVFRETSASCDACILHSVPCHAQQPVAVARIKTTSLPARMGEEGASLALLRKLDEMESMIKQIRGSGKSTSTEEPGSLSSGGQSTAATEDLEDAERRRLLPTATSTPSLSNSANAANGTDISIRGAADALETFGNTPLVSLFREALNLPDGDGLGLGGTARPAPSSTGPSLFHHPAAPGFSPALLLSDECMRAVLEVTSFCFAIFPPCTFYVSLPSTTQFPTITPPLLNRSDVQAVISDIRAALCSDNPDAAAKALMWLALCLFELPRAWTNQYAELADTQSLIDIYRRQAATMLSITSENGEYTRHAVEARCLQVKLNVDLGFPRKAWLTARKAVNACLLLGYHRAARQDKPHEQSLWHMAVHTERETSLILGLPSSISNVTKSLLPMLPPDERQVSPAFRLLYEMMVLLGTVTDHNQTLMAPPAPGDFSDYRSTNYAKTFELDQKWESFRQIMPADFWQEDNASAAISELRPVDLYVRQTTKVRYFILGRYIHLPYTLKAINERRYAYSRAACLEASRGVIAVYQTLRHLGGAQWAPCGLLDFESFSSAMVIALTMLQDSAASSGQVNRQRTRQDEDDYNLLVDLSLTFRKAHLLKGSCTVAQRAADVMGILLPILQGQYQRYAKIGGANGVSTADHDIIIPFFGRLRVTFPHIEAGLLSQLSESSSPSSPSLSSALKSNDTHMENTAQTAQMSLSELLPPPPPIIEFGVPFCNQDFHFNFDCDLELNGDWMTNVEAGIYDWTTLIAPGPK